ncbi:MAG: orotidine-5'-phosphate decarboxylase [bacterium]
MPAAPDLIVALDTPDIEVLNRLIATLSPAPVLFKSHWISFPALGFKGLKRLADETGSRLFLDFKLHDIPNTVKEATRSLLNRVPMRLMTIHALGGPAMVQTVRQELDRYTLSVAGHDMPPAPKLLAITLLTSLSVDDLHAMGLGWKSREEGVLKLATMAKANGADGVVCTFAEAAALRREFGNDLLLVCPGLRLEAALSQDHAETATPQEARELGVDYVVVGRPILNAPDPLTATEKILEQLQG